MHLCFTLLKNTRLTVLSQSALQGNICWQKVNLLPLLAYSSRNEIRLPKHQLSWLHTCLDSPVELSLTSNFSFTRTASTEIHRCWFSLKQICSSSKHQSSAETHCAAEYAINAGLWPRVDLMQSSTYLIFSCRSYLILIFLMKNSISVSMMFCTDSFLGPFGEYCQRN